MPYTLRLLTRSGDHDTPFPCYTDALGEAVRALRNGTSFRQLILDPAGQVMMAIEPEGRRIKLRPPVVLESGSVVTPGLSATDCTFELADGV